MQVTREGASVRSERDTPRPYPAEGLGLAQAQDPQLEPGKPPDLAPQTAEKAQGGRGDPRPTPAAAGHPLWAAGAWSAATQAGASDGRGGLIRSPVFV